MSVNSAKISEADLNYISQWNSATRLDIIDRSDVAVALSNRVSALKAMANLNVLSLNINQNSYEQLRVKPFLNELQSVQSVNILAGSLTDNQFQTFVKNQESVKRWDVRINNRRILYQRNANIQSNIRNRVGNTWLMERQKEQAADRLSKVRPIKRSPIDLSKAKSLLPDHLHWSNQYSTIFRRMNRSVLGVMWWTMKKFH